MELEIVHYSDDLCETLCELMNEWGDIALKTETLRERMKKLLQKNEGFLLMTVDEKKQALGYVAAWPVFTPAYPPFLEITELLVHPGYRSRGIGRMLLRESEKLAVGKGYSTVRLSSQTFRQDAHRFYEREGYLRFKESFFFEKELH